MAKRKAATRVSEDDILKEAMERVRAEHATREEADAESGEDEDEAAEAKPPKKGAAVAKSGKKSTVTYKPKEGDPPFTIWFGMKFEANLPRETSNPELIKLASQNPWFSVDGKPPAKRVVAKLVPTEREEIADHLDPSKFTEIDAADAD